MIAIHDSDYKINRIRDELTKVIEENYMDGYDLVSPRKIAPHTVRSSDNGTLFRSEYDIILQKLGASTEEDKDSWETTIRHSMNKPGLTVRAPSDTAVDAPDNLYGILAACKVLDRPQIAKDILSYGIRHLGYFNPSNSFNWEALQWRQPQMLFATICASNNYKWYKPHHFILSIISALVIYTSCSFTNAGDTTSRILCWMLIQATIKDSLLCKLASKVWFRRLYKDYGCSSGAMSKVAAIYFEPGHPLIAHWVD